MNSLISISCFLSAYLLGAIPFAYIAGRALKGVDIRDYGSGNVGATNVLRTLGKGPGIGVLLLDMAKGVVAVALIPQAFVRFTSGPFPLSVEWVRVICGALAIAGHIWTVFLGFKGGKGVATTVGVFFGMTWNSMLIGIGVFVIIVYVTRYISVGSIGIGLVLVVANLLFGYPVPHIIFSAGVAVLIIYTHRSNIRRLLKGEENKLGRKSAAAEKGAQ